MRDVNRWVIYPFVVLLVGAFVYSYLIQTRPGSIMSRVSRVKSDQRTIATALEKYAQDHQRYPESTMDSETQGSGPNGSTWSRFADPSPLTTPVAYMIPEGWPGYMVDPFSPNRDSFLYVSTGNGWLLASRGPDQGFNVDVHDYVPSIAQPSAALLLHFYDPTNGVRSGGDVIRVMQ
jgi:hypothetical protein